MNNDFLKIKYVRTSCILVALSLLGISMMACQNDKTSFVNKRNIERIANYVTCPTDTIRMILDDADSICALFKNGTLNDLAFDNEFYNEYINPYFRQRTPSIVQVYATYHSVTLFPTSEANAAFAWHEIAQCQIADFYGKEEVTNAEVESYFNGIDSILNVYDAGTQHDINNVAWRRVMMADFRLITAYKALYDQCAQPSLLASIHGSYCYLFEIYRVYCDQINGYWSDLPRQLACLEYALMEERQHTLENLLESYTKGEITLENIKESLDARPNNTDDWDLGVY